MLRSLSEIRGEDDELEKMIEEAKLSPRQQKILEQQRADKMELLADGYVDFDPETGEILAVL